MPRTQRADVGGIIYHAINRANGRLKIFKTNGDYEAFEQVLAEAKNRIGIDILAYCIMPNHWHLVLRTLANNTLSAFMGWLTMTHTQRWHAFHNTAGTGHLYQGRFKSFPVEQDDYFIQLVRYVERNPLRAKLVKTSQDWQWSSLWRREQGTSEQKQLLTEWPIPPSSDYLKLVNHVQPKAEVDFIRTSIHKSKPLGSDIWVHRISDELDLKSTLRYRGRPRKGS